MIRSMPTGSPISLDTRILDLPNLGFRRLGPITARKLAAGIAGISSGKDLNTVTVDDLLHYLPMRYEDRSKLTRIRDLTDGMEASLDRFVELAGGRPIKSRRSFRTRLYIFKISATDRERSGKDVVIWTFLSGPHAPTIIENYTKKFLRGVRFIAFGKWVWDGPDQTYSLQLKKPDEIEVLPPVTEPGAVATGSSPDADPSLAGIHVGRCVPVYRKISDLRPKQLREIIHALLTSIDEIPETLPADLRERQHLINRAEALREIHFPADDASLDDYENARSPA